MIEAESMRYNAISPMSEINKADIGPPGKLKRERLKSWFSLALGAHLLEGEYFSLGKILPELFGFHILQIGALCEREFLEDSCISHKVLIQLQEELLSPAAALQCLADNLPIMSDSIDVVVLPHSLEFLDSPHRLLREIERILIGEGHLIIIGFNPWSLCGLWRLFLAWRDEPPWNGHFYGMARIKDWLSLLDFELIKTDKFFYRQVIFHSFESKVTIVLCSNCSFWKNWENFSGPTSAVFRLSWQKKGSCR